MSQLGVLGMPDDCFYIKSKVSSRCFDAHMVLWGAFRFLPCGNGQPAVNRSRSIANGSQTCRVDMAYVSVLASAPWNWNAAKKSRKSTGRDRSRTVCARSFLVERWSLETGTSIPVSPVGSLERCQKVEKVDRTRPIANGLRPLVPGREVVSRNRNEHSGFSRVDTGNRSQSIANGSQTCHVDTVYVSVLAPAPWNAAKKSG